MMFWNSIFSTHMVHTQTSKFAIDICKSNHPYPNYFVCSDISMPMEESAQFHILARTFCPKVSCKKYTTELCLAF